MQSDSADLARRVSALEKKVASLVQQEKMVVRYGVRKRASWGIGALPIYDIAFGPDIESGQARGHAKGSIAIGDIATGFIAVGALARGVIAVGGLAIGLIGFGGLCISLLIAIGGLAIGAVAMGGAAVGGVAIGGGAVGYYACGAGSMGQHFVHVAHQDPSVTEFLRQFGLEGLCPLQ